MCYWLHKTCLPLKMYYLFFLCKWNMNTKVQQASVEPEVVMYIKVVHWRSVRLSPQPVIVQDRRAKPPLKSSLPEPALSAFSTCTAECHNYFYHISGACAALTRGGVSLLLNSFASQSHMHVTKANYVRTHADGFLFCLSTAMFPSFPYVFSPVTLLHLLVNYLTLTADHIPKHASLVSVLTVWYDH